MLSDDDVTQWVHDVKQGQRGRVEEKLVDRYLQRLTSLARRKIGHIHAYEDEDDVALSAFKSFFKGVRKGKFTDVADRESLWSLLAAITIKKSISLQRRHLAKKRDVRKAVSLESLVQSEPTDAMVNLVLGEAHQLLEDIDDDSLRTVACMRMEGYSNKEIAARLGRSEKTVERKLSKLRKYLAETFRTVGREGE